MRILYGVQGTGNGHLSRARAMARAFADQAVEVDYLFSGRDPSKYFDMECFTSRRFVKGQTFVVRKGCVNNLATLFCSSPLQLAADIRRVPVADYDLVLSDFEPVSAWAARLRGVTSLGLGHQYAFNHAVPQKKGDHLARLIMRYFAPTTECLGMHWYHFNQPILPPLVDLAHVDPSRVTDAGHVLVYLPFEEQGAILEILKRLPEHQFIVYSGAPIASRHRNVTCKPASRQGFLDDLISSHGVIANAGFELSSEAISLGKKLMVKPLRGQAEQASNAIALNQLGLGASTDLLTTSGIDEWLRDFTGGRIDYPDVAQELARWIAGGCLEDRDALIQRLWSQTRFHGVRAVETASSFRSAIGHR